MLPQNTEYLCGSQRVKLIQLPQISINFHFVFRLLQILYYYYYIWKLVNGLKSLAEWRNFIEILESSLGLCLSRSENRKDLLPIS